jgi:hypothetical protein
MDGVPRVSPGRNTMPDFEDGEVAEAAGMVPLGHLEQARQHRSAQESVLFTDRVGKLDRSPNCAPSSATPNVSFAAFDTKG